MADISERRSSQKIELGRPWEDERSQGVGDWFDPETWKRYADLANEWKTIGGVIFLAVVSVSGWATGFFRWLGSKFRRAKPSATSKEPADDRPLRFVVDDRNTFHTPIGSNEKTGTRVCGVWDVMNVTNSNLVLLKARLGGYASTSADVGVQADSWWDVRRALPARRLSRIRIEFVFQPPIHSPGQDLISDVIFTDNYAEEHKLLSVRFPRFK